MSGARVVIMSLVFVITSFGLASSPLATEAFTGPARFIHEVRPSSDGHGITWDNPYVDVRGVETR